jgi:hypothetical protein
MMNETQDRAKAYSFGLNADQATGLLRMGWRKFKVSVTQYSWSGYTIVVRPNIGRQLQTGKRATLEYQGSSYQVNCLDSRMLEDGSMEIHLKLDESEAKQSAAPKKKPYIIGTSIRLNQRDPILGIATWICLLMLLMILPGWGERWGTSSYLSDGFRSVFINARDAFRSILGM